jgi:transcriptional regulator with XRE-family HTH domain
MFLKTTRLPCFRDICMREQDTIANGIAMARIDGEAIRRLRETRGLTQLYVATAVGVTTDTISRWENRRYPSIKKENAIKLAETLEVPLASILENEAPEAAAEEETGAAPPLPRPHRGRYAVLAGLALALLLAGGLGWWYYAGTPSPRAEAIRILPLHAPPGQSFPVVIQVAAENEDSSALILKESLPPGCIPLEGEPAFTSVDQKERVLKWIGKTGQKPVSFAYLAKVPRQTPLGKELEFVGTVTLRQGRGATIGIAGSRLLTVAPFHWADTNSDGKIDDEEILTVYDTFGALEGIDFDRDLIEKIWAAKGYRWNRDSGTYETIP